MPRRDTPNKTSGKSQVRMPKSKTATERRAPSNRPLKVGETLRHALDNILRRGDIHDAEMAKHNVTVTEVRMAPDLAHATIFVTPLGGLKANEMMKELKRCAPMLRTEIARTIQLRHAPELHFQLDTSYDYATSIELKLGAPEVKRDLKAGNEPDFASDDD